MWNITTVRYIKYDVIDPLNFLFVSAARKCFFFLFISSKDTMLFQFYRLNFTIDMKIFSLFSFGEIWLCNGSSFSLVFIQCSVYIFLVIETAICTHFDECAFSDFLVNCIQSRSDADIRIVLHYLHTGK